MSSASPSQSPPPQIQQFTVAFVGNALGYVVYGIYVAVAVTNLVLLRKKKNKILFAFTLFQLVVTTLYNAVQMYSSPPQFLSTFNLAGQSYTSILSPWPNVFIGVAYVMNMWCSDAFLVYRCYVVTMGNKYAIAFPVLMYLALVGSSIAYLKVSIVPSATYSTAAVQVAALCYWSISVALNAIASCIIAVRFWLWRRQIFRASAQQGSFYLTYIAMTLESALLYTAFGIAALVVLALNSILESVFFTILGPIQVLAPALIVNRIARGISMESDFNNSGTVGSLRYAVPQRQSYTRSASGDHSLGTLAVRSHSDSGAKLAGRSNDGSTFYLYNTKPIV